MEKKTRNELDIGFIHGYLRIGTNLYEYWVLDSRYSHGKAYLKSIPR